MKKIENTEQLEIFVKTKKSLETFINSINGYKIEPEDFDISEEFEDTLRTINTKISDEINRFEKSLKKPFENGYYKSSDQYGSCTNYFHIVSFNPETRKYDCYRMVIRENSWNEYRSRVYEHYPDFGEDSLGKEELIPIEFSEFEDIKNKYFSDDISNRV